MSTFNYLVSQVRDQLRLLKTDEERRAALVALVHSYCVSCGKFVDTGYIEDDCMRHD